MNPYTDLPQNFIGELNRTPGMFLASFKNSKLSKWTFLVKDLIASQRWVPKLVIDILLLYSNSLYILYTFNT